jgi:hypothetical protein
LYEDGSGEVMMDFVSVIGIIGSDGGFVNGRFLNTIET